MIDEVNSRFILNCKMLAIKRNIKIYDLEKELGFSKGLISRLIKHNKPIKVTIDTVLKAEKLFNMDMHEILAYDYRKARLSELEKEMEALKKSIEENP